MPHFTIEYSANATDRVDMDALCEAVHIAARETGIFPMGGIRVRALRCDAFAVADSHPSNAFAHMIVASGAGRDRPTKKEAGQHIWAAFCEALGPAFDTPHFAASMEWREIDPGLSWKKNAIHPRLAAKGD